MNRRNLLTSLAAGIVAVAMPAAAGGVAETDRLPPDLDADLIRMCAQLASLRDACNATAEEIDLEEGVPEWDAYIGAYRAIKATPATTMRGVIAKAQVAKQEADLCDDSFAILAVEDLIELVKRGAV